MNDQTFEFALLLLLALLIGVLLPVLLELRAAVKSVRKQVGSTGARVDACLDEIHGTAQQLNKLSGGLEGGDQQVARLLTALGNTAETLERVQRGVHVSSALGAAVAPAIMAFLTVLREPPGAASNEDADQESPPVPVQEGSPVPAKESDHE